MLKLKKVFSYMAVAFLVAAGFVGCDNLTNNNEATKSFTVTASESVIYPTGTSTLTASIDSVTYTIESGSEYATLSENVVTGVKSGEVVIKASAEGYISTTVSITVQSAVIKFSEDGFDGSDTNVFEFYTPTERKITVVPSEAELSLEDSDSLFDSLTKNDDGTWTIKKKASYSSKDYPKNFYFANIKATVGEDSATMPVAVVTSTMMSKLGGTYWNVDNSEKGIAVSLVNNSAVITENDKSTTENHYGINVAVQGNDVKSMYLITDWTATSDNKIVVKAYENSAKKEANEVGATFAVYYDESSSIKVDFASDAENISETVLSKGSAYNNEYEGEYYSKYIKDSSTYIANLVSGDTTIPVIVDIKTDGSVNFTSKTYYGSYSTTKWIKNNSNWTVEAFSDGAFLLADKPCLTLNFNNNSISVSSCNKMGDFNSSATSGYSAYTPTTNVPVSFTGVVEEPGVMLSCWVDAMGGQEFGHAVFKGYKITSADDGTLKCTLNLGTGVGVIYTIGFVAFVDPSANGSSDESTVSACLPSYYDSDGNLQKAEYTVSTTDFGVIPAVKQVYAVDSMTFPVSKDKSEYNIWFYINSNIMGVQFGDGSGTASSNMPGQNSKFKGTLTIDWDIVTVD